MAYLLLHNWTSQAHHTEGLCISTVVSKVPGFVNKALAEHRSACSSTKSMVAFIYNSRVKQLQGDCTVCKSLNIYTLLLTVLPSRSLKSLLIPAQRVSPSENHAVVALPSSGFCSNVTFSVKPFLNDLYLDALVIHNPQVLRLPCFVFLYHMTISYFSHYSVFVCLLKS